MMETQTCQSDSRLVFIGMPLVDRRLPGMFGPWGKKRCDVAGERNELSCGSTGGGIGLRFSIALAGIGGNHFGLLESREVVGHVASEQDKPAASECMTGAIQTYLVPDSIC